MTMQFKNAEDCKTMEWAELRYIFSDWPVECVNQLYIDTLELQDNGFY